MPTTVAPWQRLLAVLLVLATSQVGAEEVNVYSARKEALVKPLLDRFSSETGIQVNLVTARADALLQRLQSEGRNSPADVLITVDLGRLHRAKTAGVLQPIESTTLTLAIPDAYRDPEGYWFGLSLRTRPIMYVKDKVDPTELSTYEALADPRWKGQICVRSSDNIYNQSLVASLVSALGETQAESWAHGLVANFARTPTGGDRDQIKAAAAGQCTIAIANSYYLARMLQSDDAAERSAAEKLAIFWPNQEGRGAHVNVSGAGITAASKHADAAVELLEFMVTDPAQQWYAEVNNEYPVKPGVPYSEIVQSWGSFKADTANLSELGELNAAAVRVMDRAGWR